MTKVAQYVILAICFTYVLSAPPEAIDETNLKDYNDAFKSPSRLLQQLDVLEDEEDNKAGNIIIKLTKLYKFLQKYYLPVPENIANEQCQEAVNAFPSDLLNGLDSWSLKMGDSWGKIPDGFLFGNVHTVGMFEECLKINGTFETGKRNKTDVPFMGKYCKIYYKTIDEIDGGLSRSGPGLALALNPVPFFYGTCMPSTCTNEDLFISLNVTLKEIDREVARVECQEEENYEYQRKFDGFDAFVCAVLGLLIVLAICGMIIDETDLLNAKTVKDSKVKIALEVLVCFSLTKNFKSIFKYKTKAGDDITCMHGMRAVTIVWIITCHQYTLTIDYIFNTLDADKYQDPIPGQFITDGYLSVDTFFCLSGILLAYRLFPIITAKLNGMKFAMTFLTALIRRFMRLFPSIFMVSVFCATILRFLGFGHRHPDLEGVVEVCRETWWMDSIFVDNFVHGDMAPMRGNCLDQCWYTSIEMQLFLIIPFLVLPFIYFGKLGVLWFIFTTLLSMAIPLIILLVNDFPPVLFPSILVSDPMMADDFTNKYYKAPWCRAAPWFIGIWVGLFLSKNKSSRLPALKTIHIFIGYVIALVMGNVLVVGLYNYNHVPEHEEMETWLAALYAFFSRPLWALSISWVVVTCHAKRGGYVNVGLSWWGWQPLSRLTFGIFLISPQVQLWWSSVLYLPTYYSYLGKLFEVCGVFFISFLFAIFLAALVERPFLELTNRFSSSKVSGAESKKKDEATVY